VSTEIKCEACSTDQETATISLLADDEVKIDSPFPVFTTRATFLAAVASEFEVQVVPLDAIVIERADLPKVEPESSVAPLRVPLPDEFWSTDIDGPIRSVGPNSPNGKPEWHRARGLAHLALAEYLREHPPVDEAQVAALATVLREATVRGDFDHYARQLIRAGWSK
jgi:hypothetical protein